MSKLNEKYEVIRTNLKCDYFRYPPSEINTINTVTPQIPINIPSEGSVFSLLKSYFVLNIDVLHAASNDIYADKKDIGLINLRPIALFSCYKLKTSSGKHLEVRSHAHCISLLYKLIGSAKYTDDLSIVFDRDGNRRQREILNNKNIKGNYHVRIMLRDVFGFPEHQEQATFGLGYKLTLTRNTDKFFE